MRTPDPLRAAEAFLHAKIPLTRAMGVRVVPHADGFAIEAPVALNHNHLHTGFGGSINSVATLAGYVFLWLQLRGVDANIVVGQSEIRFVRPIRETIRAICIVPEAEQMAAFHGQLRRNGKARLALRVRVEEQAAVAAAAEFTGTFIAFSKEAPRGTAGR